jgi:hypothetical protein
VAEIADQLAKGVGNGDVIFAAAAQITGLLHDRGMTLYQQPHDAGCPTDLLPDLDLKVLDSGCYDLQRGIVFKNYGRPRISLYECWRFSWSEVSPIRR